MNQALTIIDNIFPDVIEARDYALTHDFTQAPEYDGHKYPGFAPVRNAEFTNYVAELLGHALGFKLVVSMAAFVSAQGGFKTQQWIHCDNSCSKYAVVIHLHNHAGRGTMFWHHAEHGYALQTNLTPEQITQLQQEGKAPAELVWRQTDYADSRLNRAIIYPTKLFHSRWPEDGIGDTPADSRLTMVLFVDVA